MSTSTLQTGVFNAIGTGAVRWIKLCSHLMRFCWAWALLLGLVSALVAQQGAWVAIIVALVATATFYLLAEHYLQRLDHIFFSSPGNSKREVFYRHFADQVSRDLGLRMTEPGVLHGMARDEARAAFAERLDQELKQEFRRFDWKLFVREVVKYSR